ncbi:hypothetical protein D9758_001663 [Tetrapyrgos nigripes]|uniref:Major facilitator superfamily (MFS) profile domain-containing protein n=1 Tax=Tetrapyrgos nigripes TaxID=182062 RepID=A0A8H5GXS8_9AGAR|nr:hypothetical protein D9758_001663 [Tetrapyrgos nigripes]
MPSRTDHHDEESPLLPRRRPTPLPITHLLTVCLVRLAEPIAFCQIFPYINEFIAYLHVTDDPSQTGFYSGIVESTFALTQLLSIYTCSRLSDSIGRKPVIIAGTIGVGLATIFFGLSTSLTSLLLSRSLAGLCAGTAAVMHAVLGEITDKTNQAKAFPMYGLVWPLGGIIGPLIGGSLSEPAKRFPELFKDTIFDYHPFFLPCFIAGCVSLCGVILAWLCLEETLPSKAKPKAKLEAQEQEQANVKTYADEDQGSDRSSSPSPSPSPSRSASSSSTITLTSPDQNPKAKPTPSLLTLLQIPIIRSLCLSGFTLEMNAIAFNVLFVLFSYTAVSDGSGGGGLGLPPTSIGYALATSGFISITIQIFLLPFLLKRWKAESIYHFSMKLWVLVWIGLGSLGWVAKLGTTYDETRVDETESRVVLWIGIGIVLALARFAGLGFGVSMILIRNNTHDSEVLGTTNGLVQLFMCTARMVTPTIVSSAFALCQEPPLSNLFTLGPVSLGSYLWVALCVGCALGSL